MSNPSKDPQAPATATTPGPSTVDGWQIHEDSMGGSSDLPVAYLNKRTAELECESKNSKRGHDSFNGYTIIAVKVRLISDAEGAVGRMLVTINRTEPKEVLRAQALAKLTREEKEALNL